MGITTRLLVGPQEVGRAEKLMVNFSDSLSLIKPIGLSLGDEEKKEKVKRIMSHEHSHHLPCLHCHPHSYIRMVQHLIERCLILRMSCDDCIKALSRHASIQPLVTLTVWKELLKENKDFFQTYLPAKC